MGQCVSIEEPEAPQPVKTSINKAYTSQPVTDQTCSSTARPPDAAPQVHATGYLKNSVNCSQHNHQCHGTKENGGAKEQELGKKLVEAQQTIMRLQMALNTQANGSFAASSHTTSGQFCCPPALSSSVIKGDSPSVLPSHPVSSIASTTAIFCYLS